LRSAEPKKIGVSVPSRKRASSKAGQAASARPASSRSAAGVVGAGEGDALRLRCAHRQEAVLQQVVGTGEIVRAADRPGDGRSVEGEGLLDLVDQVEGVAALAVQLVDEGEDRDVAQAADLEQLAGLRLDALAASSTITAASTAVGVR
jgi:hypothetical protein